jgi:hypothetical protein
MKALIKAVSMLLLFVLGIAALAFTAPAANASESKKEVICKATASDTNPFNKILVARDSIINGGHGENGIGIKDIVPPFTYNFDGGPEEQYLGQNWTDENKALWTNGCAPSPITLTPILPEQPIATCLNQNPTLTIPAQPNGINVTSAADDKGNFTVFYELPKNTAHNTYLLPEGFINPTSISTLDTRQSDALWDPETKTCKMPDTGAGDSIQWWMIPAGAGMLLLASILFFIKPMIGRRNA